MNFNTQNGCFYERTLESVDIIVLHCPKLATLSVSGSVFQKLLGAVSQLKALKSFTIRHIEASRPVAVYSAGTPVPEREHLLGFGVLQDQHWVRSLRICRVNNEEAPGLTAAISKMHLEDWIVESDRQDFDDSRAEGKEYYDARERISPIVTFVQATLITHDESCLFTTLRRITLQDTNRITLTKLFERTARTIVPCHSLEHLQMTCKIAETTAAELHRINIPVEDQAKYLRDWSFMASDEPLLTVPLWGFPETRMVTNIAATVDAAIEKQESDDTWKTMDFRRYSDLREL